MQEHILTPYSALPCTPDYLAYEPGRSRTGTPYTSGWISLPTALAESCDTYFYQVGDDFYELPREPRPPAAELGVALRVRRADRHRRRPRGAGPRADARVAARRRSPASSTARSTASGSRATRSRWRSARATSTVTPLQMARFYAMIANGGQLVTPHIAEDVEQPTATRRAPQVLRRFTPPPPTATRRRPDGALDRPHRASSRRRTRRSAPRPASSARSRSRSPARPGTAEKSSRCPARRRRASSTSPGGAATGRPTNAEIVVCAVIENGGHGGTAAAPAALKVFQKYFKVQNYTATTHVSD